MEVGRKVNKRRNEMPSNLEPNLSQIQLMSLLRLLKAYSKHIAGEQPLAAQVIDLVLRWVNEDIE